MNGLLLWFLIFLVFFFILIGLFSGGQCGGCGVGGNTIIMDYQALLDAAEKRANNNRPIPIQPAPNNSPCYVAPRDQYINI